MTPNFPHSNSSNASGRDAGQNAEETLRLLAELPPPAELTDRVHRRIAEAQVTPERQGFWSLWMPVQRFQFAGAAVLVIAVAGSVWSVYHRHPQAGTATQIPSSAPQVATPGAGAAGGFVPAGAERVPPTLKPIQVPQGKKKKPAAGHSGAKPSAKALTAEPAAAQSPSNP